MKALIKCPTCRKMVMGSVVTNPSRSTVAKAKKISEELQARATRECECECAAIPSAPITVFPHEFAIPLAAWNWQRIKRQELFMAAYKQISDLILRAASIANTDPLACHELLEQAMDLEYKLLGHCDDASSLRDSLLGNFEPNKEST